MRQRATDRFMHPARLFRGACAPAHWLPVSSMTGQGWGGGNSNTPPQTLQTPRAVAPEPGKSVAPAAPAADRITGGEDWLEAALYIEWDPIKFAALALRLDELRDAAAVNSAGAQKTAEPNQAEAVGEDASEYTAKRRRRGKQDQEHLHTLPGSAGRWMVHPVGMRLGESGKGPVCRWRIERDGVIFGIRNTIKPHETIPSAIVRITGDVLLAADGGGAEAWALVLAWIAELGGTVTRNAISRVDMATDIPGVGVQELMLAVRERRLVTRAKRKKEDSLLHLEIYGTHTTDTGFRIGSNPMLRVYDKLAELYQKQRMTALAWMINKRWGGVEPEKAVRVEYQLRREFLTAAKCKAGDDGTIGRPVIDSVEDYFAHRDALALLADPNPMAAIAKAEGGK